jgi:hypothetical protein
MRGVYAQRARLSGSFGGDEADFAVQTRVECRAVEAGLVLVTGCTGVPMITCEGELGLSLPMSLEEEKEKTKKFAMHACRGASDGMQERDAVAIVSVSVAVSVNFPVCVDYG